MTTNEMLQKIIDNQERLIDLKQEQLQIIKQSFTVQNELYEHCDTQFSKAEQINDNAVVIQQK